MVPYGQQDDNQPGVPNITASYQASGLTDGVIVPLIKSVFIGLTTGILVGLLTWAFHLPVSPWMAWLVVWFVVMPLSFVRYSERAQWMIERITGADLTGDGRIGPPVPYYEPPPLRVIIDQDNGRKTDIAYIPAKYIDRMRRMAPFLLNGKPFSEREWKGVLHQGEFDELRDEFLASGLVRWNNETVHQQGLCFTKNGRRMLEEFLSQKPAAIPTIPYPTDDASNE